MNMTFKEQPKKESTFANFSKGYRSTVQPSLAYSKNDFNSTSNTRGSLRFDFSLENYKKTNSIYFIISSLFKTKWKLS